MKRIFLVLLLLLLASLILLSNRLSPVTPPPGIQTKPTTEATTEETTEASTQETTEATTETTTEPTSANPVTPYPPYYIKVNCQANTVTIYSQDTNGEYTVPVKAMVCSTGRKTPQSGIYKKGWKWEWLSLFGNVYGQYATQIGDGNILFHSVPYTVKGDPSTLLWEEFDKLGEAASMGCIRLQVEDAKWIYDNYKNIYRIAFYNDPDPGPLGKPTAPKISDCLEYRGWDPTDPRKENPWRK